MLVGKISHEVIEGDGIIVSGLGGLACSYELKKIFFALENWGSFLEQVLVSRETVNYIIEHAFRLFFILAKPKTEAFAGLVV